MKCCKCDSHIPAGAKICPSCGMRLKEYRQLVCRSNVLYNQALASARNQDLSGALLALRQCLQINKRQNQARNLYGLILYQLGEFGQAAHQWKLCMAFDPEDEQAKRLYKKGFGSKGDVARMNDATDKYNQALHCAKEGALDLAVVHLKKVLASFPCHARAARLMALVCIKQEDYARACRVLKPLLKVNTTDTQAIRYLEEATSLGGGTLKGAIKEQEERETREHQKVIIPPYSEKNELLHDFICIAGGLVLGILACMFLIFPSVKQRIIEENNNQVMSYGEEVSSREVQILDLQNQLKDVQSELKDTQNSLKAYTAKNGILNAYADLISAMNNYVNGDYLEASKAFTSINPKTVDNSAYQTAYETMNSIFEQNILTQLYQEGRRLYRRYNYSQAEEYFKQCLKLKKDYAEVMYWLGLCYYNSNDKTNAQKYFYALQKDYADTVWSKNAKRYMPYTGESSASGSESTAESSQSQSSSASGENSAESTQATGQSTESTGSSGNSVQGYRGQ